MRMLLSLLTFLAIALPAAAADLAVTLKTPSGQPVRDAVVSWRSSAGAPAPRPAGAYAMAQEGVAFKPFVLIVPVGATVVFPNHDKVRHHVYSFSPAKRFQLKLYGREEERSVVFDKAGIVALGCNIHDAMTAFIAVTDTPFAAKSDESGRIALTGLPAGGGVLTVWHPYLRTPRNEMSRPLRAAQGAEAFVLDLRAAPAAMKMSMDMHGGAH